MGTPEENKRYILKLKKVNPEKFAEQCAKRKAYAKNHANEMKVWYKAYKSTCECEVCGESHIACLDFHHRNPEEKKFRISQRYHVMKIEALIQEIEKCRILCSNCHRKEHYEGE